MVGLVMSCITLIFFWRCIRQLSVDGTVTLVVNNITMMCKPYVGYQLFVYGRG